MTIIEAYPDQFDEQRADEPSVARPSTSSSCSSAGVGSAEGVEGLDLEQLHLDSTSEQLAATERVAGLLSLSPSSPHPDKVAEYRAAATVLGVKHLAPCVDLLRSIDPELAAVGFTVGVFTALCTKLGLEALEVEADMDSDDLGEVVAACLDHHGIVPGQLEALLERAATVLELMQETAGPGRMLPGSRALAGEIREALEQLAPVAGQPAR